MFLQIIISLLVIATTIIIHGIGTTWIFHRVLKRHDSKVESFQFKRIMRLLSLTAVILMLLHFTEIALWAIVYLKIPELTQLDSWEEAIYFSSITYTSVGYGDITLPPFWRIMTGFEAMNGVLLFGWSTALFYAVVHRTLIQSRIKENNEIKTDR